MGISITRYNDGSVTVSLPRGPEAYDAPSGELRSEATVSAEEFDKAVADSKKGDAVKAVAPNRGWLNEATLPAALRDIAHLGDSELDVSGALEAADRPAPFAALDKAAASLERVGAPGKNRPGSKAAKKGFDASGDPIHPPKGSANTGPAASPAIHNSPEGAGSKRAPGEAAV